MNPGISTGDHGADTLMFNSVFRMASNQRIILSSFIHSAIFSRRKKLNTELCEEEIGSHLDEDSDNSSTSSTEMIRRILLLSDTSVVSFTYHASLV